MASLLAKYISKRVLGETLQNKFGTEDPYFEQVPATRLDGQPSSKTKKRRKALPPGINEHDGKVLTKVKRRAYRLDMSLFSCFGIRFGWSSVIGIVPGIGDLLDAFMAMMVFRTCQQVEGGLPADVKAKMIFNIIVDFGIGLIPFLGDIADAVFRANTKNAIVLENFLRMKGEANLKAQGLAIPAVDPSDPEEYERQLRDERGHPPGYTTTESPRQNTTQASPVPASSVPTQEARGGWFSGFGSKKKQPDVETGIAVGRRDGALPPLPSDQPQQNKSTLQKSRPG